LAELIPEGAALVLAIEGKALTIDIAAENDVELAGVEMKDPLVRCQMHMGVVARISGPIHLGTDPGKKVF
jgi:hypothetical protein